MFGGFSLLLVFLVLGESLSRLFIPLPGNVTGMILLTCALALGIIKVSQIKKATDFLLNNMIFFFVPAGVGVMVHLELIAGYWLEITGAVIVSTLLVMILVGIIHKRLTRPDRGSARGDNA